MSERELISASSIGRYAYCPLSWWLSRKGHQGKGEELARGKEIHEEAASDMSSAKSSMAEAREGERIVAIFSLVSILLAINALTLVFPEYFVFGVRDFSSNVLLLVSILWLLVAIYFFLHAKQIRYTGSHPAPKKKGKHLGGKTAAAIILTSILLIFNGLTFVWPLDTEIWSHILMILALLWLIGTTALLFLHLRHEPLSESEGIGRTELLIAGFSIVASVLAINGMTIKSRDAIAHSQEFGSTIVIASALWMFVGIFVLVFSITRGISIMEHFTALMGAGTKEEKKERIIYVIKEERKAAVYFAFVALALGLNSFYMRLAPAMEYVHITLVIAMVWIAAAGGFLILAMRAYSVGDKIRRVYHIDDGNIDYVDTMGEESPPLLKSEECGLSGRPDLVIRGEGGIIPVEIKTGKVPRVPYFSHIVQLGAYCVLVEEVYGKKPPHGIIRYQRGREGSGGEVIMSEYKIAYDDKMRDLILGMADEMRAVISGSDEAHRSHGKEGKCRHCSRRDKCPERLV